MKTGEFDKLLLASFPLGDTWKIPNQQTTLFSMLSDGKCQKTIKTKSVVKIDQNGSKKLA